MWLLYHGYVKKKFQDFFTEVKGVSFRSKKGALVSTLYFQMVEQIIITKWVCVHKKAYKEHRERTGEKEGSKCGKVLIISEAR